MDRRRQRAERPRPSWGSLAFAVALFLLFITCGQQLELSGRPPEEPGPRVLSGTNWDGEAFDLSRIEGKVGVVVFGYTYCPDVCPFALAKLKQLYQSLGEQAEDVAVVFASVDPHRDTVEKLSRYVPNFDPRFYGVALDATELDAAMQSFDLEVSYGTPLDGAGTDSFYYVEHTGSYFLFDRQGNLRSTFPPNATADEMLPDVEALVGDRQT